MLGVRDFSSAATMRQERIVLQLEEPVNVINFASITGYVTAVYDGFGGWHVLLKLSQNPKKLK